MEKIRGFFNELNSSQLNYVKAGEFISDNYKTNYIKLVNEFIQYCKQFKLDLDSEQSYAATRPLETAVVWFKYSSTDYTYPVTFTLLCNYEKSEVIAHRYEILYTKYFLDINGEVKFKAGSLEDFKKELERWINQ